MIFQGGWWNKRDLFVIDIKHLPSGYLGVKDLNKFSIFSRDGLSKNIKHVVSMVDTNYPEGTHSYYFVTNVTR